MLVVFLYFVTSETCAGKTCMLNLLINLSGGKYFLFSFINILK